MAVNTENLLEIEPASKESEKSFRSFRLTAFFKKISSDETGSIAVVVIGLFVITVASLMVMTDVSALIVAKRSLVQATEAAAQRGVHTLDKASYYQGKANMFTVPMALATGRPHPSIPIDCNRGGLEVLLELNSWSRDQGDMKWRQLKGIQLTNYQCDGQSLAIDTRSEVNLPFRVPFTSTDSVFLTASAGTANDVQEGFYLFGIRLH
ncbi:Putative Flp pilus-assembly TadG-like, N-terminal [Candidatus Nanopelagicaceae bacterium]